MAVTAEKTINAKGTYPLFAFPVASGETIYGGTLAALCKDGYLYNMDSTAAQEARIIVLVADESANSSPAATTANGSISGSFEAASVAAGDKTVRNCYVNGIFELTFTAIAQSDVGKVVYASDNYTCDETQIAGVKIGTLVAYISATAGWVDLNAYHNSDGTIVSRGNLTAATGTTVAAVLSWANPTGETIMIENLIIDITTGTTGAATFDIGIGTTTASSDVLIDGCATSVATVFAATVDGGTNGGINKATSAQYVVGTASADASGLVGTYAIYYRIWE